MKKALGIGGFFPTETEAAIILEPGNGAFDAAKSPTVLSDRAHGAMRSAHLYPIESHLTIQTITIVALVAITRPGSRELSMKSKSS